MISEDRSMGSCWFVIDREINEMLWDTKIYV
jgi:hypothetical protein